MYLKYYDRGEDMGEGGLAPLYLLTMYTMNKGHLKEQNYRAGLVF